MLRRFILLAGLLASLAQAIPLADRSEGNEQLEVISLAPIGNNGFLSKNALPNAYRIKLIPNLVVKNCTFEGESHIDITVDGSTTKTIVLHAVDLKFEKGFTSLNNTDGTTSMTPTTQETQSDLLTIEFQEPIAAGNYTLNLKYSGELKEEEMGFYVHKHPYDDATDGFRWEAWTKFNSSHARQAFPCFDEPDLMALFTISIKLPENYMALSDSLTDTGSDDSDQSWARFDSKTLISTDDIDFRVVYNVKNETSNSSMTTSTEPSTSPSTEPSTSSSTEPSTSPSSEPSTSSSTKPSTSPSTEPSTSLPTGPTTNSPNDPSTSSSTVPEPKPNESKPNSAPHISLPTLPLAIFIGLLMRLGA